MDERPAWDRSDDDDEEAAADGVPTEGVRIIRGTEATDLGEREGAASRRSGGGPRYGDRPEGPPEGPRPELRFPLRGDEDINDVVRPRVSGVPSTLSSWAQRRRADADHLRGGGGDGDDSHEDGTSDEGWTGIGARPRWRDAAPGDRDDDDESRVGTIDDRERPVFDDFADDDLSDRSGSWTGWDEGRDTGSPGVTRTGERSGRWKKKKEEKEEEEEAGAVSDPQATRPGGPRSADRHLGTAVAVGVGLAVVAIVSMALGPGFGVAFVAVVVTLCAAELFGALQRAGHQPATLLGLVATTALVLSAYWRGEAALPLVIVLTVVFTLLWYLIGITRVSASTNAGLTILTVTYLGLFGSFGALMLRAPSGVGILMGTVVAVVASDVGALFAGRRWGRRPMAPSISPNKTLEGALGGAVASVVVSFVVLGLIGLHPWSAGSAIALGCLVAVLAPIGDLVESMIKRDLAVKDMGSILPGHGGLIDRFDAILFVLPAAYYLVRLLEIA